jgi:hypothetical protein
VRCAAALAVALAACGGGPADPDGGAPPTTDAAVDGAAAVGTWANPIVVPALPATVRGDTRLAVETRAERYDCAPTIDERGPELVYQLTLDAPTVIAVELTAVEAGADVDVHLVRTPATAALATDCVIRDDRALVADLAAGTYWLAIDSYAGGGAPAPGSFTLTVTAATSTACLSNPIPACSAGDRPDVNGAPTPPPGLGGCPPGMAAVAGFCIDRWEAALVTADGRGHSPYANPGSAAVIAVSAPGVVPQGYINQTQAGRGVRRRRQAPVHRRRVAARVPGQPGHDLPLRPDPPARGVQRRPHLSPGDPVLRVERRLGVLDDRSSVPGPAPRRPGPHRRPPRLRLGRRHRRSHGQPARVDRGSRRHLPRRLLRRHPGKRRRLPVPDDRPRRQPLGLLDGLSLLR